MAVAAGAAIFLRSIIGILGPSRSDSGWLTQGFSRLYSLIGLLLGLALIGLGVVLWAAPDLLPALARQLLFPIPTLPPLEGRLS